MKRITLLLACLAPFFLQAQSTINENFDNYRLGSFDEQFNSLQWTGWSGNNSNADISPDYAYSGNYSLKVSDEIKGKTDVIAHLDEMSSGTEVISFMQYIPSSGSGAYYNFQHNYTGKAGDWAVEVYFGTSSSTAHIQTNGEQYDFQPTFDSWVEQKFIFDFDNNSGSFYYGNIRIHTWDLTTNAVGGKGVSTINAINFFAHNNAGGEQSLAYYDDLKVTKRETARTNDENISSLNGNIDIAPNPTTGWLTVNLELEESQDVEVTLFDLSGKTLSTFQDQEVKTNQYALDLTNYASGIYLVKVVANGQMTTKRVVKR